MYNLTDEELAKYKSLGFKYNHSSNDDTSFVKGNMHIWQIRGGWQTALLKNGSYCGRKNYADLMDALERFETI